MARTDDKILWIDCLGGLVVGCLVLSIFQLLSLWENLPTSIVLGMGVANLLYGGYSLYVTTRNPRPMMLLQILSLANMFWLCICITIAVIYWHAISTLGFLHVIGEGLYVASLGYTEWRWRNDLAVTRAQIGG